MFTVKLHHLCATNPIGSCVAVLASIAFIGLSLGAIFALIAVTPRLWQVFPTTGWWKPKQSTAVLDSPGLIFWQQVLVHGNAASYTRLLESADASSLVNEVAKHTFVLASIADRKYRWVNRSIWISWLPAVLGALAMCFVRAAGE